MHRPAHRGRERRKAQGSRTLRLIRRLKARALNIGARADVYKANNQTVYHYENTIDYFLRIGIGVAYRFMFHHRSDTDLGSRRRRGGMSYSRMRVPVQHPQQENRPSLPLIAEGTRFSTGTERIKKLARPRQRGGFADIDEVELRQPDLTDMQCAGGVEQEIHYRERVAPYAA